MTKQPLQYYLHDDPNAFRMELSGSLSGAGTESVFHAWQTARSIIGDRPFIVDITFVVEADERGRALLLHWHRHRTRIIAASAASRSIAESVIMEPFPQPPAARPGFFVRLTACAGTGKKLAE